MVPVDGTLEITRNPVMQEVLNALPRVASSDVSVLITGEHGTGKEWAAHIIHRLSARSNGPFLPFDCASMQHDEIERELFGSETLSRDGIVVKRGALEDSWGGTLLLNEIGSLPATAQLKIARALEYKSLHRRDGVQNVNIHVRIISTLSQDYTALIENGTLSKDMFYRLSAVVLELPPLRERREDIPLLIETFLKEFQQRQRTTATRISPEALEMCLSYDWPGNVRHLKNSIEYSCAMCAGESIQPGDLPASIHPQSKDKKSGGRSSKLDVGNPAKKGNNSVKKR